MAARPARSGRCCGSSTSPGASRGPGCCGAISATVGRPDRSGRGGRRWSTARHLAELFAAYAASRPAMIAGLGRGSRRRLRPGSRFGPTGPGRPSCGDGSARSSTLPDPAERVGRGRADAARATRSATDLPARLSVFGATRLEPDHVPVLAALAAAPRRPPLAAAPLARPCGRRSPSTWRANGRRPAGRRVDDRTERLVGHRLLAYLGRDSRELQLTLARHRRRPRRRAPARRRTGPAARAPCSAGCRPTSPPTAAPLPAGGPPAARPGRPQRRRCTPRTARTARSRCCARCWSGCSPTTRRCEPRDIVVMCPDIETLRAADRGGLRPGHRRRPRPSIPATGCGSGWPTARCASSTRCSRWSAGVVELADSRMAASALLDLCATAPVARKFGFTADDLDRLQRPGGPGRGALGPGRRSTAAGTGWTTSARTPGRPGLDRLLLGVAMDESEPALHRHRAAAGRRRLLRRRPGRPAGRAASPGSGPSTDACRRPPPGGRLGRAVQAGASSC